MNTGDTVLLLYRVILLYVISEREFLFSFPRFSLCPCIGLYRALHCLYRQRVIYWLISEL